MKSFLVVYLSFILGCLSGYLIFINLGPSSNESEGQELTAIPTAPGSSQLKLEESFKQMLKTECSSNEVTFSFGTAHIGQDIVKGPVENNIQRYPASIEKEPELPEQKQDDQYDHRDQTEYEYRENEVEYNRDEQ